MAFESEQQLENKLLDQLAGLGYSQVTIDDEAALFANLKSQLEALNKVTLSDAEFSQIKNQLNKGNILEKAEILRDRLRIDRDDNSSKHLILLDSENWKNNLFQVTNQVTIEGRHKNRYDVTILINGLPLVQIELKRRGLELKEAFNQIDRYQKHSYWAASGLFQYVQLFVISTGGETKYFANNAKPSSKQVFYWTDNQNRIKSELADFAKAFLKPKKLAQMICRYIVINETEKLLMVLRPYQVYATEAIVGRVAERNEEDNTETQEGHNGYIWHTTGSGKTLTSFKTAQLLTAQDDIDKVVFVVDRRDLDSQTVKEFNKFVAGSVDGTDNTKKLVSQFADEIVDKKKLNASRNTKLIVTTIQKLNTAIKKSRHSAKMEAVRNQRIVFIFDECHRSQFGDTHKAITKFFTNHQLFGFTGTPIFVENALSKTKANQTTEALFDDCLHKYTIVNAIRDDNVLRFSIEYVGRYHYKDGSNNQLEIETTVSSQMQTTKADNDILDADVEAIDTKELLESDDRLDKITDYIITNHARKTHSGNYNAMFCVSSVDMLIKYYDLFKKKRKAGEHKLKIGTIFSYTANEDPFQEAASDDEITKVKHSGVSEESAVYQNTVYGMHRRDKLDEFISDYNADFGTGYSTKDSQSFTNYYNDLSSRVKKRDVDLLLVVNMFLTGFDAKTLNTLFVDKNLRYHGLIQAFSRTNRIVDEQKSKGNIVCFRNLKKATDDALTLFSNEEAKSIVLLPDYEEFVKELNVSYALLKDVAATPADVHELEDEDAMLEFVTRFREMRRLKNILESFADFDFDDLKISEEEFTNYEGKYQNVGKQIAAQENQKEKVSVLAEVDFELDLLHKDLIDRRYILSLIRNLKDADDDEYKAHEQNIMNILNTDPQLFSKRELIIKFIEENLPQIDQADEVDNGFDEFWEKEKEKALNEICKTENLSTERLKELIDRNAVSNRQPLRDELLSTMESTPKLLERESAFKRISKQFKGFVETFYQGI
jgi:type I restriction enzyme R subunit